MVKHGMIDLSGIKDPAAVEIIKFLLERVRVLEEEVARLKKNSSTSSKPPSSDITKPAHEQRQPGERKIGGQAKHEGKNRAMLPPEKVDETKVLPIEQCPDCGDMLREHEEAKVLIQQTIELREDPVEVTEYHRPGRWCNKCKKMHYAELPAGVIEDQLCGPRLQALIAYMKGSHATSYRELGQFCSDVLGFAIARSTLCQIIAQVTEALEAPCQELEEQIAQENVVNIDESGWYDSGDRHWVWLFCTELIAFFSIQPSRGCKVLKEILGSAFQGAIISDFYSAYVSYASLRQQFCLAHLIRDIKFLTTLPDAISKEFGEQVLRCFKILFKHWHERDKIPRDIFLRRCKKIQRRLFMLLTKAALPKGEALTMKKRLLKHWDSLFRFVEQPELFQPTNNLAEQTMRFVVRIRRQTQGSRSLWGRLWAGRIMSVLASCRKQKRSSWHFLLQAIHAQNFGSKSPSLLPTYQG
jgi:transposase